ncbi:MAG: CHAD domain-containing protein [Myxococcales bacterium]|nr:CHAD domain-containing protein [Myxococcales bacterium]
MSESAAAYVSRALSRLDAEVPGLLLRVHRQSDAEAIHDLRVTVRRIRTLLAVARPLFGRHYVDDIRGTYTRLARATGALRDEEVFRALVDKHRAALAPELQEAAERFLGAREERERALRARALEELAKDDVSRARGTLSALLSLPVRPKKDQPLHAFARKAVLQAMGRVDEHRDAKDDDAAGLHDLRIAYKRLRYTMELFMPALPPDLVAGYDLSVRFQKRLGDLHDLDLALLELSSASRDDSALAAALTPVLVAARSKKLAAFRGEMFPTVADAD